MELRTFKGLPPRQVVLRAGIFVIPADPQWSPRKCYASLHNCHMAEAPRRQPQSKDRFRAKTQSRQERRRRMRDQDCFLNPSLVWLQIIRGNHPCAVFLCGLAALRETFFFRIRLMGMLLWPVIGIGGVRKFLEFPDGRSGSPYPLSLNAAARLRPIRLRRARRPWGVTRWMNEATVDSIAYR
jgi:hypothetical protein